MRTPSSVTHSRSSGPVSLARKSHNNEPASAADTSPSGTPTAATSRATIQRILDIWPSPDCARWHLAPPGLGALTRDATSAVIKMSGLLQREMQAPPIVRCAKLPPPRTRAEEVVE